MIITSQKALRIVSNHEVLKLVPELLMPVEAYQVVAKKVESTRGCQDCKKSQIFEGVEKQALDAIGGLPSDAIARLKRFLNANELYLNQPEPGKKGTLRKLD